MTSQLPSEIRKACMLLGVCANELSVDSDLKAWKQQITSPSVAPELGGDNELAIYLNSAKDTLVRWLEGSSGGGRPDDGYNPRQPSDVARKPKPDGGNNVIKFPFQDF